MEASVLGDRCPEVQVALCWFVVTKVRAPSNGTEDKQAARLRPFLAFLKIVAEVQCCCAMQAWSPVSPATIPSCATIPTVRTGARPRQTSTYRLLPHSLLSPSELCTPAHHLPVHLLTTWPAFGPTSSSSPHFTPRPIPPPTQTSFLPPPPLSLLPHQVEISLQPWHAFKPDGVILFSDILTPLPGMNIPFDMAPGPIIMDPIRTMAVSRRMKERGLGPSVNSRGAGKTRPKGQIVGVEPAAFGVWGPRAEPVGIRTVAASGPRRRGWGTLRERRGNEHGCRRGCVSHAGQRPGHCGITEWASMPVRWVRNGTWVLWGLHANGGQTLCFGQAPGGLPNVLSHRAENAREQGGGCGGACRQGCTGSECGKRTKRLRRATKECKPAVPCVGVSGDQDVAHLAICVGQW